MMFNQTLRYLLLFTVGSSTSVFNLLLFMMFVLISFTSVGLYLFKIDLIEAGEYNAIRLFATYLIDMFQVQNSIPTCPQIPTPFEMLPRPLQRH